MSTCKKINEVANTVANARVKVHALDYAINLLIQSGLEFEGTSCNTLKIKRADLCQFIELNK